VVALYSCMTLAHLRRWLLPCFLDRQRPATKGRQSALDLFLIASAMICFHALLSAFVVGGLRSEAGGALVSCAAVDSSLGPISFFLLCLGSLLVSRLSLPILSSHDILLQPIRLR